MRLLYTHLTATSLQFPAISPRTRYNSISYTPPSHLIHRASWSFIVVATTHNFEGLVKTTTPRLLLLNRGTPQSINHISYFSYLHGAKCCKILDDLSPIDYTYQNSSTLKWYRQAKMPFREHFKKLVDRRSSKRGDVSASMVRRELYVLAGILI